MESRRHHTQRVAAARSGLSERTARRIERDPRLPSQKITERPRRRQTVDPLGGLWENEILPLLAARPVLRAVTLLEEMQARHPDPDWDGIAPRPVPDYRHDTPTAIRRRVLLSPIVC